MAGRSVIISHSMGLILATVGLTGTSFGEDYEITI